MPPARVHPAYCTELWWPAQTSPEQNEGWHRCIRERGHPDEHVCHCGDRNAQLDLGEVE